VTGRNNTAVPAVDDLSALDRATFDVRWERYAPDIVAGLERLYPDRVDQVVERLRDVAANAFAQRSPELRHLDEERLLRPNWLQEPSMVGYACYADGFGGTLRGVGERVDHLRELGVTYLHLMPLLLPREGDNDGGYAVADYRSVRPDLGTMADLADLTRTLRAQGISLVLDLVLNHVAREHEWAMRAKAGEERYLDYFLTFPTRDRPDAYEATLPEVFPDFAPGNFTWDETLQRWVWTTFNEWQWDVNWANPDVLVEYADIITFLANQGVEVLRLDAIAFTWKRLGTNCQNQPEVHDLTQVLRAVARIACPATAFKAEAIVGPRDLVPYLGTGRHVGRVSDLAYHNSLMVQTWNILATGDTRLAVHALAELPPTPTAGTWIAYVRCHDDIGWAIDDRDAEAVGVNGWLHRRYLADFYAGEAPGSWGRGLVFQFNPQTGDKRTSGTAASLLGLDPAVTDRPERRRALARIFVAHAIAYSFGGLPVIWSGDELGQPNDPHWADDPAHADDNRWAHRPALDPTRLDQRHDSSTEAGAVFAGLAHLGRIRARTPELHSSEIGEVIRVTDAGVLAFVRRHASGPMVCAFNVTGEPRRLPSYHLQRLGMQRPINAIDGHDVTWGADGDIWLPPYAAFWVVDRSPR
jgi:amylosucrase